MIYEKNNLSIRRPTHIGRIIYNNIYSKIDNFINQLIKLKINFKNIKDIIDNIDEISFQFNMAPSNIIDQKGKKSIIIKTQHQEKLRVSALLCILTDGTKIAPYLVFKGKNDFTKISKISEYMKNKKDFYA